MDISEFDYSLDKKLIAQQPLSRREASKMMILNRDTGRITHSFFYDFLSFVSQEYILVLNNTKVFPARLYAHTAEGKEIEVLLVKELTDGVWETMAKPLKKIKKHATLYFDDGIHSCTVTDFTSRNRLIVTISPSNDFWDFIERYGKPPLPPYIKRLSNEYSETDWNRYQTVFAQKTGSIAAPTAGFHFSPEILNALQEKNIHITYITLHVGSATFQPLRVTNITEHTMENEYFEMSVESFNKIKNAKEAGKKILAVGTTSVRTIESVDFTRSITESLKGWTNLFIYPGYEFKMTDAMLTNFHLPKSTLLMLVYAFASKKYMFAAYQEAMQHEYRFYSYGDCMLIL